MIYGSVQMLPMTGTVYVGLGTVWENPTHRLPILNPTYVEVVAKILNHNTIQMENLINSRWDLGLLFTVRLLIAC
jgi:hypothetical protein